jgi:ABC-2 type transport system ATP-binding protein
VFGQASAEHGRAIRRRVGMATCDERSFYWRLTARQNLRFFARLIGVESSRQAHRIDQLLALLDLAELGDRPYRVLSTGNRQRLAIARALLHDPELLLLDEPTNSLDPIAATRLRTLIAERIHNDRRRACLVTSHNLEEVEGLCSRIAILRRGTILETADLPTLRARHAGAELITITTRHPISDTGLATLHNAVPDLRRQPTDTGAAQLCFSQPAGAVTLNTVLAELHRHQAIVLRCESKGQNLKAIFDALMTEEPNDA